MCSSKEFPEVDTCTFKMRMIHKKQGETVDISEQLYYQIYCYVGISGILALEAFVK